MTLSNCFPSSVYACHLLLLYFYFLCKYFDFVNVLVLFVEMLKSECFNSIVKIAERFPMEVDSFSIKMNTDSFRRLPEIAGVIVFGITLVDVKEDRTSCNQPASDPAS